MDIFSDYLIYCFDREKMLLYTKWLRRVSSVEYRTGHSRIHALILEKEAELWFQDYTHISTPDKEDQLWTVEAAAELLTNPNLHLKRSAVVVSKDVFFMTVAKSIHHILASNYSSNFEVNHFKSIAQAFTWLLEKQNTPLRCNKV